MEMLTKLLSAGITRRRVCNIIDPRRVKLGIDISQGIGSNLRAPAEEKEQEPSGIFVPIGRCLFIE